MGAFNREYSQYGDGDDGRAEWAGQGTLAKWLLISLIGVFVSQFVLTLNINGGITSIPERYFPLSLRGIQSGYVWQVLTYPFCNPPNELVGFLFGLLFLWFVVRTIEQLYGLQETIAIVAATTLVCALTYLVLTAFIPNAKSLFGLNVWCLGLLMLVTIHFPTMEILFFGVVPVQLRWLTTIYVVITFYPILMLSRSGSYLLAVPVAAAMLAAMGWQFLYYRWGGRLTQMADRFHPTKWVKSFKRTMARRKFRVYTPEPTENLEAEVDRILAKISEHGSESLTERERTVLSKASERYKQRAP